MPQIKDIVTTETDPALTDYGVLQESAGGTNSAKKITLGVWMKIISKFTDKATPSATDEFIIQETGGGTVKKTTLSGIVGAIADAGTTEIKTANYTITDGDGVAKIFFNASTADMTATLPTLADNQNRLLRIENDTELTITGCTTNSATAVVTMASTTGLLAGMNVYGNNVNSAITISSVDSGVQITLSANCNKTEAGTAILSFANTVIVDGEGAETIDGMTTIELPRGKNFIEIQALSDEWKIINEKISAQLRLNTHAGYGSTDNKIVRFTNSVENIGNMFVENHSTGYSGNTEGLEITINKPGKYSFSSTGMASGSGSRQYGISLNSSQLTTSIQSIALVDILNMSRPATALYDAVSWSGSLVAGDTIRIHSDGGIPATAANSLFSAFYMGN